MIWLLLALVAISAPMTYLILEDARKAMVRRQYRLAFKQLTKGVLTLKEAFENLGYSAQQATFAVWSFKLERGK